MVRCGKEHTTAVCKVPLPSRGSAEVSTKLFLVLFIAVWLIQTVYYKIFFFCID